MYPNGPVRLPPEPIRTPFATRLVGFRELPFSASTLGQRIDHRQKRRLRCRTLRSLEDLF